MTSEDAAFEQWQRVWLHAPTAAPRPEELQRQFERAQRKARVGLAVEALGTVAVFAALLMQPRGEFGGIWGLAIGHTLIVWIANLLLRRGTWRSMGQTSTAYLIALRKRLRATRRGAEFGLFVVGAEAAGFGVYHLLWPGSGASPAAVVIATTIFVVTGVGCVIVRRRAMTQARALDALEEPGMPGSEGPATIIRTR